jgi:hypothetical protein
MTPRFEVKELEAFQGWAIEVVWPDGRRQPLIGIYTSEEMASENMPSVARRFLAEIEGQERPVPS